MEKIGWLGLPVKTWLVIGVPFLLSALAPYTIAMYLLRRGRVNGHE